MMVDLQTVCCLCGDIGFPDKLFRCNRCHHRFQHSYCSNYYGELAEIELCDWCQTEEKNVARHSGSYHHSRSSVVAGNDMGSSSRRSEYSSEKVKQHPDRDDQSSGGGSGSDKGKTATSGVPSPRPGTRRYKLLKDVMC
ncbi:uncharacterized protein LOC114759658 [Neltuma alba]|uniref:uncharacterized protein LOC114759658 n=1 Tax=Neltuma alba TaxID=207710 RepID=UPI0010A2C842|nr:uncharacterized protein LOC114759658 [Prosopis alba]